MMAVNRISQLENVLEGEPREGGLGKGERTSGGEASSFAGRFNVGDPVRVMRGVFAGVHGCVAKRVSAGRLEIALDLLQSGVWLEIAEDFLVRAD
jgi:transcription antitermination factor NusG